MKPFNRFADLLKNKRFLLTILLAFLVAGYFWTQSRYPQLDQKAMMGAETHIEAIGFDVLVEMPEQPTIWQKIYANSANWMWTNRKGMTFGVIFGAIMMNLLSFLNGFQFRSRFANSALGIVMGAPLGLCVNCSTPVAHGLHESGAKTETMLAAMMSSPTLNVIVLTMLFAMFPPWLAFMKIGMTLVFILGGIPLLTKYFKPETLSAQRAKDEILETTLKNQIDVPVCHDLQDCEEPNADENLAQAAFWVVKNFFLNFWYLVKITVPLMILAGILGAIIVSIVPLGEIISYLPDGRITSWASMAILAIFCLFLPAPMTFDVIATAVLYNAGMPVKYVAVVLFTLGIFSVYPFMTIWNRISRQIAFGIFGTLIVLGVAVGAIANRYQIWDEIRQQKLILEPFVKSGNAPQLNKIEREKQGVSAVELLPQLKTGALVSESFTENGEVSVSRVPFNSPRPAQSGGDLMMKRYEQKDFGIAEHENYSVLKMDYRYQVGRGIASGDTNRDGWTDFVITSDAGFALYLNKKGESFVQQRIEIPQFDDKIVTSAALVDLNNDGWLDLYFTVLRGGNFVIYSKEGQFLPENLKPLENQPDAVLTGSTAFGDIDRDGKLDIVLGNVSALGKTDAAVPYRSTRNVWLHGQENGFAMRNLEGADGESLTDLLSDINGDGNPDLIIGNDMQTPDMIYLGDGKGGLRLIKRDDNLIPETSNFTMSVTSADLDNDLKPELFFGSVAFRDKAGQKGQSKRLSPQQICAELNDEGERTRCEQFYNFRAVTGHAMSPGEIWECNDLTNDKEREACIAFKVLQTASVDKKSEELCKTFPAGWEYLSFICQSHFAPVYKTEKGEIDKYALQKKGTSILLKFNENDTFDNKTDQFGIGESGWTWNAKFADLDNDGWQDLFVANGWIRRLRTESNFFYRNLQGKTFEDITEKSGLASNLNTLSYTYLDIDNDGDLDIIVVPTVGAPEVYINQSAPKNSIAFELNDRKGNFYGIGSKIIINYADGKHQMREIQASGGYLSFDAPVAYFGLGDETSVKSVEIDWSTGEKSVLDKEFKSGARYIINRGK